MSSTNKELSIVIISYNVKHKIIRCLKNIINYPKKWEIIVIDNNSSDGSYNLCNKKFGSKLLLNKNFNNIGFSRAVNQGVRLAKGKTILLLNPDTIPTIKAIKKILNLINKNSKIGIAGGKLTRPHYIGIHGTFVNKISFLVGLFEFTNLKKFFKNNSFYRNFYFMNDEILKPRDVWGVSGAFMFVKRRVFEKIGMFDDNIFMYLEDVDFCLRAKHAGIRVIFYPGAEIIHESGSSSQNKYHINIQAWRNSRKYLFKKHLSFLSGMILVMVFSVDELVTDLKHLIINDK